MKAVNGIGETVGGCEYGAVLDVLRRLSGKGSLDDRRFAVADGVAEYAVFIGHVLKRLL